MREWLVAHANNLPSGNPLPTEMEVAAHFGASRQTANKVLTEMARDGLVKRIKGLGTFVQSREGAVLDGETGARLGRVVLAYPNWFSYDIWTKIDRAILIARELGLGPLEYRLSQEAAHDGLAKLVSERKDVRGVVLIPPGAVVELKALKRLDSLGVPVVVLVPVDQVALTTRVWSLAKDYTTAGHLLVAAMARRGHQRIAYIANEPWSASTDLTYAGIKQGLYANGLRLKDLVRSGEKIHAWEDSMVTGRRMTMEILALRSRPTALIYDSMPGAIGGLGALGERGLRVPDDISVAVNDEYNRFEEHLWPSLTTITVDRANQVRRALKIVLEGGNGGDRLLREDVKLVERGSVGTPP
jgi:LacI family transcriptional regulator